MLNLVSHEMGDLVGLALPGLVMLLTHILLVTERRTKQPQCAEGPYAQCYLCLEAQDSSGFLC